MDKVKFHSLSEYQVLKLSMPHGRISSVKRKTAITNELIDMNGPSSLTTLPKRIWLKIPGNGNGSATWRLIVSFAKQGAIWLGKMASAVWNQTSRLVPIPFTDSIPFCQSNIQKIVESPSLDSFLTECEIQDFAVP
jgi:hypothetical protein